MDKCVDNVLSASVLGPTQCYTCRNIGGRTLDSDVYACCFCLCSVKSTQSDVLIVKLCRDFNRSIYFLDNPHQNILYLFHLNVSGQVYLLHCITRKVILSR